MSKIFVDEIAPNLTSTVSVPSLQLPSGSVIQVVQTSINTTFTATASSTWQDSPLEAVITPTSTTSKILVLASALMSESSTSVVAMGRMVRKVGATTTVVNSDALCTGSQAGFYGAHTIVYTNDPSYNHMRPNNTVQLLDEPNTTSEITYNFQLRPSTANAIYLNVHEGYLGSWQGVSFLTLMEIAG